MFTSTQVCIEWKLNIAFPFYSSTNICECSYKEWADKLKLLVSCECFYKDDLYMHQISTEKWRERKEVRNTSTKMYVGGNRETRSALALFPPRLMMTLFLQLFHFLANVIIRRTSAAVAS